METALIKLDAVRQALVECRSVEDGKDLHDRIQTFQRWAKFRGATHEEQNELAEVKLVVERWMGKMLAETVKMGRPLEKVSSAMIDSSPTLADMGISGNQSSHWQREASVPEEVYERWVAETKDSGGELTSAALYRLAMKGHGVHFSSKSSEWYTPQGIIDRVIQVLGGIELDPCSNVGEPHIPAQEHLTIEDDGLSLAWFGSVYMNPPYGNVIKDWVEKLCSEYEAAHVSRAIALVPARTDTAWFRRMREYPRCFIWGRLRFSGQTNSAPFPSMAVYLGDDTAAFIRGFSDIGDIYRSIRV